MRTTKTVVFFLYENQQMHSGPSRAPGAIYMATASSREGGRVGGKQSKHSHGLRASRPHSAPQAPLPSHSHRGGFLFLFLSSALDGSGARRGYAHRFLLHGPFKHRTTLAYGSVSCNQSLARYGTAGLLGLSSDLITHPTAQNGPSGRE